MAVRLVVDDLACAAKLVPGIVTAAPLQRVEGVELFWWQPGRAPGAVADLVIEAFACDLPAPYVEAMAAAAAKGKPAIWINLEYLSAEAWVTEHHLMPSPHPAYPLTKTFFFPGFSAASGGLIRERGLTAAAVPDAAVLRVLVFAYAEAPLAQLLQAMERSGRECLCHVSAGTAMASAIGGPGLGANHATGSPHLAVGLVPFVPQLAFDALLADYHLLFVRGEDSFVRAQWAARPFVWHIYPQSDGAHWRKLDAFLDLYCAGMARQPAQALRDLWRAWNGAEGTAIGPAWTGYLAHLPVFQQHAGRWAQQLRRQPDLASKLLSFYQKMAKI